MLFVARYDPRAGLLNFFLTKKIIMNKITIPRKTYPFPTIIKEIFSIKLQKQIYRSTNSIC